MNDREKRMVEFISRTILRGRSPAIDENTRLVSSGAIDSLAQVEVVMKLEEIAGVRFRPGAIAPEDLETVAEMVRAAEDGRKRR